MKKLLIGLTLLASISTFASKGPIESNVSIQSRGLDALANIYRTHKAGNTSERSLSEFSQLMDQADDVTQECLTKTLNLVIAFTNQKNDVDEKLLSSISLEMDQASDKGQSCLTDFSERLID